jgi:hypothetical protein
MMFPPEENASKIWSQVVEAVIANKLGTAAKIAADGPTRLICIYTKDFSDTADVRRVVEAMVALGLTSKDAARPIYYKCDAFTYLDIGSGNPYGIPASLYNSKDILNETTPVLSSNNTPKKRTKNTPGLTSMEAARGKRSIDSAFFTAKEPAKKKPKAR